MEYRDFKLAVSAALDAPLTAAGFASGQFSAETNVDPLSASGIEVIYCAAHDEFSDRHPWLPQSNAQPRGTGACLDLNLMFDQRARFVSADLEGYSLGETLQLLGYQTFKVRRLTGAPLPDALPVLVSTVVKLLRVVD